MSNLHIKNRGLAWRLETADKSDPIWLQLQEQVRKYNLLIDLLASTEGFLEIFATNGLQISIDEIEHEFGKDLANEVTRLGCYQFSTDLVFKEGYLFDANYAPQYTVDLPGIGEISFAVGATDGGYPAVVDKNTLLFWNWSDDARDFTFALWSLLDDLGVMPEAEDSSKNYDGFYCYDQYRETATNPDPNLLRCLQLLERMGYLKKYSIAPEECSPWFRYRANRDGTIGVAVLDKGFAKDRLMMEKLRLVLSQPECEVTTQKYFLTNCLGEQELSANPGTFGGHQKYKIYGRMDCSSANRHIKNGKYIRGRVFFTDEATAIAAGYRPCAVCMREEYNKWKEHQVK